MVVGFGLRLGIEAKSAEECLDLVLTHAELTQRFHAFKTQVHLLVLELAAAVAQVVHKRGFKSS